MRMSWNGSLRPPQSRLEHLLKKCIPPLCFSVIRRRRDYICMMRLQKKELDIRGTEHLKTHRGSDTTNSELYTADILRNALNVKSEQLSTGRSIEEMTGEDLSNVGHMQERSIPQIDGSSGNSGALRGNASTNSIPTGGGNVNSNRAAARKAAQLATIERNNPFDPELGAHTWIRSAEDILTYREAIGSFDGVDDETLAAQHT